jgi:signal transduction histidine kinase
MFDRLEGSFRKLSDFSSDIAHELRTPVSNLMMQTQLHWLRKGMFRITAKFYSLTWKN